MDRKGLLAEQLVGGVLVRPVLPDLGDLAVADVKDQGAVALQRSTCPLSVGLVEADRVIVVATTSWTSTPKLPPVISMVWPKKPKTASTPW
jgi:hypothetical protein